MKSIYHQISTKELVIIDPRVESFQILTAGVRNGAKVIIIDPNFDGIEQITAALTEHPANSLHIVCHGAPGCLYLGKTAINAANIHQYRQQLQQWQVSDILLYACNVAADTFLNKPGFSQKPGFWQPEAPNTTRLGFKPDDMTRLGFKPLAHSESRLKPTESQLLESTLVDFRYEPGNLFPGGWQTQLLDATFLHQLHHLTGANIAASAHPVGNQSKGGTWNLEYKLGNIATAIAFSPEVCSSYPDIFPLSFAPASNFDVGTEPYKITTGDFNADGNLDLAVANAGDDTVSILTGNGDGTFGAATNFDVGYYPYDVTTGDFNGDNKLDLAVANEGDDTVSILIGNGDGTFGAATNFDVGSTPQSVIAADFDEDGNLDLAVGNYGDDNVSVLTGNGDGTFGAATNFAAGNVPYDVTTGDFNGDSKLDLAVANKDDNNVSVLTGNGDGTFGAATNFDVGTEPYKITTGDFNEDGKLDLATANYGDYTVSVLIGNGDGTFGAATNFDVGTEPYGVTTGDLNGDGNLDLAVSNYGDNTVSVLIGNGDGTFGAATNFDVGSYPYGVITGDFNGDGKLDIAVSNYGDYTVSILLNTSVSPTLSISDIAQSEGNSGNVNYNFTVSLNIPSTQIVGVNYNTTDGTATTADSDYTSTSGNLIFNPGETQKTITVVVNGDNKYETTETFNVNLLTPINAGIVNSTAVGTITNDDAFPTISIADVSQNEGQSGTSNFIFPVTLSNPSYQTVTVNYATSNGISTAGTDYNSTSGSLSFNPGETQKTITVGVIGNTTVENNKNFLVNLSNVSNATIADNQGVGTILNDDGVPTVNNITKTGNEDTTIAFTATDFTSKFTDPNGDSLNKIKINSLPNNGILQLSSSNVTVNQEISVNDLGNLRFIPTADWNGNTSFNWIGYDGANYVQNPAAVNLTIIPVNDAPFVNLQIPRQSANANNLFNFSFGADTFKDIDLGDNLTYSATLANGNSLPNWLNFNPFTRTFVGTPTSRNEETIVLLVKATDSGNATATTSFSLLVNSSNLPLPQPTLGLEDCFCDSFVRPDINNLTGVSVAKNPVDNTLVGTNGKDTLTGTSVNEELSGLDDNDLLFGDAGIDNLIGNQGNDIVFGGSDRDWISGNEGDDVLNGNEGDDVLNSGQGNDTIRGGQGNDFVRGGQNDDLLFGDRGFDTLSGDNGNDTIYGDRNDTSNSLAEKDLIFGGSGDDLINGNAGIDTIFGEDGNDKIRGGKDDDILFGDAGNDLLYGDLGNDSLCGGDGNDTMYGGNGSPTSANGDRDELCGGADNDLLFGNEADDKLNGEDGDDTLYGGKDNDTLIGGNGNDYLSGDLGNDLLIGGSGNEHFILTSGKGNDIIEDFQDGQDLIALTGGLTFADLAIAQSGNNTIVSVKSSNELLATLNGIQASLITQQDFTLV